MIVLENLQTLISAHSPKFRNSKLFFCYFRWQYMEIFKFHYSVTPPWSITPLRYRWPPPHFMISKTWNSGWALHTFYVFIVHIWINMSPVWCQRWGDISQLYNWTTVLSLLSPAQNYTFYIFLIYSCVPNVSLPPPYYFFSSPGGWNKMQTVVASVWPSPIILIGYSKITQTN